MKTIASEYNKQNLFLERSELNRNYVHTNRSIHPDIWHSAFKRICELNKLLKDYNPPKTLIY